MILRAIIFFCCISLAAMAQNDFELKPPRNYELKPARMAFYIELGGNAGLYSLNAEYYYLYKEKCKLSGRLGFNVVPHGYYLHQAYLIEQNVVLFKTPHHLELGLGITVQRQYNERYNSTTDYFWENTWYATTRFGYRYQKQEEGLFLKAGLTPIVFQKSHYEFNASYFQLWAGVSIGVSF